MLLLYMRGSKRFLYVSVWPDRAIVESSLWHFVFKLDQIFGKIWAKCFENITFQVNTTVAAWYVTFENFG